MTGNSGRGKKQRKFPQDLTTPKKKGEPKQGHRRSLRNRVSADKKMVPPAPVRQIKKDIEKSEGTWKKMGGTKGKKRVANFSVNEASTSSSSSIIALSEPSNYRRPMADTMDKSTSEGFVNGRSAFPQVRTQDMMNLMLPQPQQHFIPPVPAVFSGAVGGGSFNSGGYLTNDSVRKDIYDPDINNIINDNWNTDLLVYASSLHGNMSGNPNTDLMLKTFDQSPWREQGNVVFFCGDGEIRCQAVLLYGIVPNFTRGLLEMLNYRYNTYITELPYIPVYLKGVKKSCMNHLLALVFRGSDILTGREVSDLKFALDILQMTELKVVLPGSHFIRRGNNLIPEHCSMDENSNPADIPTTASAVPVPSTSFAITSTVPANSETDGNFDIEFEARGSGESHAFGQDQRSPEGVPEAEEAYQHDDRFGRVYNNMHRQNIGIVSSDSRFGENGQVMDNGHQMKQNLEPKKRGHRLGFPMPHQLPRSVVKSGVHDGINVGCSKIGISGVSEKASNRSRWEPDNITAIAKNMLALSGQFAPSSTQVSLNTTNKVSAESVAQDSSSEFTVAPQRRNTGNRRHANAIKRKFTKGSSSTSREADGTAMDIDTAAQTGIDTGEGNVTKKKRRSRTVYPPEIRDAATAAMISGKPISEVAANMSLSKQLLTRWWKIVMKKGRKNTAESLSQTSQQDETELESDSPADHDDAIDNNGEEMEDLPEEKKEQKGEVKKNESTGTELINQQRGTDAETVTLMPQSETVKTALSTTSSVRPSAYISLLPAPAVATENDIFDHATAANASGRGKNERMNSNSIILNTPKANQQQSEEIHHHPQRPSEADLYDGASLYQQFMTSAANSVFPHQYQIQLGSPQLQHNFHSLQQANLSNLSAFSPTSIPSTIGQISISPASVLNLQRSGLNFQIANAPAADMENQDEEDDVDEEITSCPT